MPQLKSALPACSAPIILPAGAGMHLFPGSQISFSELNGSQYLLTVASGMRAPNVTCRLKTTASTGLKKLKEIAVVTGRFPRPCVLTVGECYEYGSTN
jgi:hypothetical protein